MRNLEVSNDNGGLSVYLAGTYATEEEYQQMIKTGNAQKFDNLDDLWKSLEE